VFNKPSKTLAWKQVAGRSCVFITPSHCPLCELFYDVTDYTASNSRMIREWGIAEDWETPTCSISQSSIKYSIKTKLFITLSIKFPDSDKHSDKDQNKVIKGRQYQHKQAALYRCGNTEVLQYNFELKSFECSATNLTKTVMVKHNSRSQCNFEIRGNVPTSNERNPAWYFINYIVTVKVNSWRQLAER
jgi:hypothetical protein